MKLDWDRINDWDFEELCYVILRREGFLNLTWLGRSGGDRGRDITCLKNENPITGIQRTINYIIQCKRWLNRAPTPTDLFSTITWADFHCPNVLIMMVSNVLSPDTYDWINRIKKKKPYDILVYDLKNFEDFLERNNDIYTKFFESQRGYYYNKINDLKIELANKLSNNDGLSLEPLSKELGLPIDDLKEAVNQLEKEGILKSNEEATQYDLIRSIEAFVKISNYVLSSNYRFLFLLSKYAIDLINKDLVKYVANRYYVELSEEQTENLRVLLSISPSCLLEALFSNTDKFQNQKMHIKQLNLTEEQSKKFGEMATNQIFESFVELMLLDLKSPESTNIMKEKKIRGFKISIEVKIANLEKLIAGISSDSVIMLAKASGEIKAGQLISASNPDYFLESSLVLANLGLLEKAIEDVEIAISKLTDPDKLKIAWNNKGVFLRRMNKPEDAILCFDNALNIDPNFEIAKKNREECREKLAS